jgi:hypothetical protein
VLITAVALAPPAPASAALTSGLPPCSWHGFSVTIANLNLQDSGAAYWLFEFTVQDGLQIRLNGRYPDARYASLQAYNSATDLYSVNGVSSALDDYQIQPDPGSVNPWQYPPGHHRRGGNAYTVTLQSDVAPGQPNTLPLPPIDTGSDTTTGYLQYRVYLPAGGDFARVPLPAVTFTLNGVSQQIPPCPPGTPLTTPAAGAPALASAPAHQQTGMPASALATPATSATQTPEFTRPLAPSDYPNADAGYLAAVVTTPPDNGDVLVIQGKAPTTPRGSRPSPWPAPFTDLRYWSLCNYVITPAPPQVPLFPLVANPVPGGKTDYGCRYDSQVASDRQGYYTFVVGTEAQRSVIERIPGATFLPFSASDPTTPHLLVLRNVLVSPGFTEAVQNVPAGSPASAAAAVMGPYYPRTAICPLSMLLRNGLRACLAGTS